MEILSLEHLRNEFLREAQSAPKLFRDLAKVEQYIAESYKTRALIELIQNADDAGSASFGIHSIGNGFIVGNNGRAFTIEDVEALCRSGSSNKHRGGSTIGYRGIGFKSVVNIANDISVFSGDFQFCFDRNKTKIALQNNLDVPLIRVPHLIEKENSIQKDVYELMSKYHYQTIFVFQNIIEEISGEEVSSLDRSSLLFLKNIKEVLINYKNIHRNIIVEHEKSGQRNRVKICEGEFIDEWEIDSNEDSRVDLVAYKKGDGKIIPALPHESVIHSFTPTNEFSGAFIKINGDYSTDPSRKTIDLDDLSKKSFNNAVSIIVESIASILDGELTREGFFSPFVNIHVIESSRFKALLFKTIETDLKSLKVADKQGIEKEFSNIRLKPEWLNFEDYENLCEKGFVSISKNHISAYPELFSFLGAINTKILNLEEIIQRINEATLSIIGCAQIFEKIINQYRYDLDSNKINQLKTLKIFPFNNVIVEAEHINKASELNIKFLNYLKNNVDSADLNMFFKKLNIQPDTLPEINILAVKTKHTITNSEENINSVFKVPPAIKKWRSAEKNAQEYLKALNIALSVKDVTEANLGYDLELMLNNGKRIYIEVKSVSSFSEPFKISNNEYSSAHNYGSEYYIALVINNEEFQIKFVPNPIKTLSFEKKCERWSWFCGEYTGELQDINQILF